MEREVKDDPNSQDRHRGHLFCNVSSSRLMFSIRGGRNLEPVEYIGDIGYEAKSRIVTLLLSFGPTY